VVTALQITFEGLPVLLTFPRKCPRSDYNFGHFSYPLYFI